MSEEIQTNNGAEKSIQIHKPFPYHDKVKDFFKQRTKTWDWFAAQDNKQSQAETFKLNLLKNTYRLDKENYPGLYNSIAKICDELKIDASVTLYQENNSIDLNARISVIENEAHIVFSGSIINLLNEEEMEALLAHELSHYLFYKVEHEEFEISQRIILALANSPESEPSVIETARIFQLYLELFCDLGALKVCKSYKPVIQMLVKVNTSLQEVNADSYLSQAKEIVLSDKKATKRETHPDNYIRSLALYYASEKPESFQQEVKVLIEENISMNAIDIFKQKELLSLTIDFIHLIIKPGWMRTSKILNLCQQYFEHHYNDENRSAKEMAIFIENTDESIKKYFSYVLLDFSKVDTDLENIALGQCFELAEFLNLKEDFEKIVKKEFKITARDFKKLQEEAINGVAQMKESKDESFYTN